MRKASVPELPASERKAGGGACCKEGTWRAGSGRGPSGPPSSGGAQQVQGLAQPTRAHVASSSQLAVHTPKVSRAEVTQHRQEAQPPELCWVRFLWVPPNREIQLHEP